MSPDQSSKPMVLVVEKDEMARELIRVRLEARGYELYQASTSEQALKFLDRELPDLAIVSAEMEPVHGKPLIQAIRTRAHLIALPVIFITEEARLTELALGHEKGYDDFLIKPFNPLVLQLRAALNIMRIRERVEVNALTHLPGNHAIQKMVERKIQQNEKFSVIYIDINHFKSFNDRYGFDKGDDVIRQTARLLRATATTISPEGKCFVGHIGGDDFIAITPPQLEEPFARRFIEDFDHIMPTYYSDGDRERGIIQLKNRRGEMENFPIMSCSVAACTNLYYDYSGLGEIASDAAEVKSFLKMQSGSHYLRDRRKAEGAEIDEIQKALAPEFAEKMPGRKMDPLGKILLNAGLVKQEDLERALKKHFETGRRLGECLISLNLVSSEDVGKMLERKLSIPYVSLLKKMPPREVLRLFTADFMTSHRVVPVEVAGDQLKLAMCDPFDIKTLDAIERITHLKPVPCLALEDEFETFLEKIGTGEKTGSLL